MFRIWPTSLAGSVRSNKLAPLICNRSVRPFLVVTVEYGCLLSSMVGIGRRFGLSIEVPRWSNVDFGRVVQTERGPLSSAMMQGLWRKLGVL